MVTNSLTEEVGDINNLGKRLVDYLHSIRPLLPNAQIAELDVLISDVEFVVRREIWDEEYEGID